MALSRTSRWRDGLQVIFGADLPDVRVALLAADQLSGCLGLVVECQTTYRGEVAHLVRWLADDLAPKSLPP